jgi:hypothetical protein
MVGCILKFSVDQMVGDYCWLYIKVQCGSERWLEIVVGCILRFSVDQKDGWWPTISLIHSKP